MPGKREMAFRKVQEESQGKAAPYGKAKEAFKAVREGKREREDENCTEFIRGPDPYKGSLKGMHANLKHVHCDMTRVVTRANRNRSKPRERGDVRISQGEGARDIGRTIGTGKHLPLPVSFALSPKSVGDSRFGERGAEESPKLLTKLTSSNLDSRANETS